jgi:hypothetical protein
VGEWRNLTPFEMEQIQQMVAHSVKTEEASLDNWEED